MSARKKILVLHLAGQYPLAGVAWQALQYVVGLTRLGHDVYYIEDSGAAPYNPPARSVIEDLSYNTAFLHRMMNRYDLGDHWAYWDMIHDTCYGLTRAKLRRLYREADALINLCGATLLREEHLRCPIRIYLETDPGKQIDFSQGDEAASALLAAHTHHCTYGENLGHHDCRLPSAGFNWITTRPPVVLDLWPYGYTPAATKFTTIAKLDHDKKGVCFQGQRYYWSKHVSFSKFKDLPKRASQEFEIALHADDPERRERLVELGWSIIDSYDVSLDLDSYQTYIFNSRAEFSVAKDLFARTRSGWFSDRSVCYLAAGKPVVTMETGFSKFIPTGDGLFAYDALEEALEGVQRIDTDYPHHARAARVVAMEHFGADQVLGKLLRDTQLA